MASGKKDYWMVTVSSMLPYLLIVLAMLGAMFPAIDMTAGEKERGTLETLISTPIHISEIVTGKYLAISTITLITSIIYFFSLGLSIILLSQKILGSYELFSPTVIGIISIVLLLIPLSLFMSAFCLAIASLGRNFKESTSLLSAGQLGILLLLFPAFIPDIELNWTTLFAPILNICLAMKSILLNDLEIDQAFIVLISSSLYTLLALIIAGRLLQSEKVLFSEDKPWKSLRSLWKTENLLAGFRRLPIPDSVPSISTVLIFYSVMLVQYYLFGTALQKIDIFSGLTISLWLLIFAPTVALGFYGRYDLRRTFSLKLPLGYGFIGTILVAGFAWTLPMMVASIMGSIFPEFLSFFQMANEFMKDATKEMDTLQLLFLFALSPAICEEVFFRGYIFSGLQSSLGKWSTVLVIGLLFGFFHFSVFRFVPTALLGMILTYAVWQTHSILSAFIIHFVNNALALTLLQNNAVAQFLGLDNGIISDWSRILLCSIPLFIGLYFFHLEGLKKRA